MDIAQIYGKTTTDDIIKYKNQIEKSEEDKESLLHVYRKFLKHLFKRGMFVSMRDMEDEIDSFIESGSYDFSSLNVQTMEQMLQEMIQKQMEKQRKWPQYTDCDILFTVINEASKRFPQLYYLLGNYDRPSDVINTLEDHHPNVSFHEEKLNSAVILYIHIENLDRYVTKEKNKLYINIFNGHPEERKQIRDFICDKLEKIGNYRINRDAKTPGSLDRIGISNLNFKWRFRYCDNFFDEDLSEDQDKMAKILERFRKIDDKEMKEKIWSFFLNWRIDEECECPDQLIGQLFGQIRMDHAKKVLTDQISELLWDSPDMDTS